MATTVEAVTKVCSRCDRTLPLSQFPRLTKSLSGFMRHCRDCERQRKAASAAERDGDPDFVPAPPPPDPGPAVTLRLQLELQRAAGRGFGEAWPAALIAALRGLSGPEVTSWSTIFSSQRDSWEAAYSRTPSPALFRL